MYHIFYAISITVAHARARARARIHTHIYEKNVFYCSPLKLSILYSLSVDEYPVIFYNSSINMTLTITILLLLCLIIIIIISPFINIDYVILCMIFVNNIVNVDKHSKPLNKLAQRRGTTTFAHVIPKFNVVKFIIFFLFSLFL